jgi:hypothetical protein
MNTRYLIIWLAVISALVAAPAFADDDRLAIKVVVVAMYEIDEARDSFGSSGWDWIRNCRFHWERASCF